MAWTKFHVLDAVIALVVVGMIYSVFDTTEEVGATVGAKFADKFQTLNTNSSNSTYTTASSSTYSVTLDKTYGVYTEDDFKQDCVTYGPLVSVDQLSISSWTSGSILAIYGCLGTDAANADATCAALAAELADPNSALSQAVGSSPTFAESDDDVMYGLIALIVAPIAAGILGYLWLKEMMTPVEVVEVPAVAAYPTVDPYTYAGAPAYATTPVYA